MMRMMMMKLMLTSTPFIWFSRTSGHRSPWIPEEEEEEETLCSPVGIWIGTTGDFMGSCLKLLMTSSDSGGGGGTASSSSSCSRKGLLCLSWMQLHVCLGWIQLMRASQERNDQEKQKKKGLWWWFADFGNCPERFCHSTTAAATSTVGTEKPHPPVVHRRSISMNQLGLQVWAKQWKQEE